MATPFFNNSSNANQTNSTSEYNDPGFEPFCWSLIIINSSSVLLNTLVAKMLISFRNKFLQSTSNRILLSLTIADAFVSCFGFSSGITLLTGQSMTVYKIAGLLPLFGSMFVSMTSLAILTTDRLMALKLALLYRSDIYMKQVTRVIMLSWLIPFAITIIHIMIYIYTDSITELRIRGATLVAFFITATVTLAVTNSILVMSLKKHNSLLNQQELEPIQRLSVVSNQSNPTTDSVIPSEVYRNLAWKGEGEEPKWSENAKHPGSKNRVEKRVSFVDRESKRGKTRKDLRADKTSSEQDDIKHSAIQGKYGILKKKQKSSRGGESARLEMVDLQKGGAVNLDSPGNSVKQDEAREAMPTWSEQGLSYQGNRHAGISGEHGGDNSAYTVDKRNSMGQDLPIIVEVKDKGRIRYQTSSSDSTSQQKVGKRKISPITNQRCFEINRDGSADSRFQTGQEHLNSTRKRKKASNEIANSSIHNRKVALAATNNTAYQKALARQRAKSLARYKNEARVTFMCVCVVFVFIICWAPLTVYRLFFFMNKSLNLPWYRRFALCLASCNSLLNPCTYLIIRKDFRHYLFKLCNVDGK